MTYKSLAALLFFAIGTILAVKAVAAVQDWKNGTPIGNLALDAKPQNHDQWLVTPSGAEPFLLSGREYRKLLKADPEIDRDPSGRIHTGMKLRCKEISLGAFVALTAGILIGLRKPSRPKDPKGANPTT